MKINKAIVPILPDLLLYGGILVIIYLIYNKITGGTSSTAQTQQVYSNAIEASKLSYPVANYSVLADKLQSDFEGIFGTNFQGVQDVFSQMENDNDVLQLIKAWGTRTYLDWNGYIYNSGLPESLGIHLNNSELAIINTELAGKNISIQF